MEKRIYFDHAATTPLDKEVLNEMLPYFTEFYGNANSQHFFGRDAQKAVDEARDLIAKLIGAMPSEIYFTSGGSEANNLAVFGVSAFINNYHIPVKDSRVDHTFAFNVESKQIFGTASYR